MGGWVGGLVWFGLNEDIYIHAYVLTIWFFVTMMMMIDVWINGLTTTEYRFFIYIVSPVGKDAEAAFEPQVL